MRLGHNAVEIEQLLAAAITTERVCPADWTPRPSIGPVLEAIGYHGVAGLLHERSGVLQNWPTSLRECIRQSALAQSMWELRHKAVLSDLLDRFGSRSIRVLLLKGTALAYDVYRSPVLRRRSDSDLLVPEDHVGTARDELRAAGFLRNSESEPLPEALRAQESWIFNASDGSTHIADLHWQVLNAPAFYDTFDFEKLWEARRSVHRFGKAAFAPSLPMMLAHACVHRGFNDCSPYFVAGRTYFGGDRLIWLYDIALIGRAMAGGEWAAFVKFANGKKLSAICLEGIASAEDRFGAFCPIETRTALSRGPSSAYLRSGQLGRATMDFWAVRGLGRKSRYALARLLPPGQFVRAKYSDMSSRPLAMLYLRRIADIIRFRPPRTFGG